MVSRRLWRASRLGALLGTHSPTMGLVGLCWCQRDRVELWHPESPGVRVLVRLRPWRRPFARRLQFATLTETIRSHRHRKAHTCPN